MNLPQPIMVWTLIFLKLGSVAIIWKLCFKPPYTWTDALIALIMIGSIHFMAKHEVERIK